MVGMDISGEVVVVTGGGGDIGRAICEIMAKAGAKVAVTDLVQDRIDKVVEKINNANPGMAKGYLLNITDKQSVDSVFEQVSKDLGDISILVAAAGHGGEDANFFEATAEQARAIYDVNIIGTQLCIKAAAKQMIPKKHGKIVIISSISGRLGSTTLVNYSGSKSALIALTQSVAQLTAKYNINVNAICPGFLLTNMWHKGLERFSKAWNCTKEEAWKKVALDKIALGRQQEPEDVAYMALFLSSQLAVNITGQAINIDGGVRYN